MKDQSVIKPLIQLFAFIFIAPSILFIAAGTLAWPMAWVYSAAFIGTTVISQGWLYFKNPDQLRERFSYTDPEKGESWDRFIVQYLGILGPMMIFLMAGLDHRFQWSPALPAWLPVVSAFLVVFGYVFGVWAMVVNQFFSTVIRIQDDRGQTVVTSGPYRLVRHPGYAGVILVCLVQPLMFNALWAFIPSLAMALVLVGRMVFEDNFLQNELEGYKEYTKITRYRLFPGIW